MERMINHLHPISLTINLVKLKLLTEVVHQTIQLRRSNNKPTTFLQRFNKNLLLPKPTLSMLKRMLIRKTQKPSNSQYKVQLLKRHLLKLRRRKKLKRNLRRSRSTILGTL